MANQQELGEQNDNKASRSNSHEGMRRIEEV